MSYSLHGGGIISGITGGVFDFSRVLTAGGVLEVTPAYILASYIIQEGVGDMNDPDSSLGAIWPLYVSYMPDGKNIQTNCGTLYDTSGIKEGRLMEGEVVEYHGVQLRIRSGEYNEGWAKVEEIVKALDTVRNEIITVSDVEYKICNVMRSGPPVSLGVERGTQGRRLFVANFLLALQKVV